jgi:hypothetical protein
MSAPYRSVLMFNALNDNELRSNFILFVHRRGLDELNVGPRKSIVMFAIDLASQTPSFK